MIVKDYRPRTGKDQEILNESGLNPLKIVLKVEFSNDFYKILHRFPQKFMVFTCLWPVIFGNLYV